MATLTKIYLLENFPSCFPVAVDLSFCSSKALCGKLKYLLTVNGKLLLQQSTVVSDFTNDVISWI